MNEIKELIADSDMILIGVGDELSERKASREEILQAYGELKELIKGKPWFLVTLNTDDLVYDAGMSEFFIVAPCGSDKTGNVITNENYDESCYLSQWKVYMNYLTSTIGKKLCMIELGAGMMYPSVIRQPFEKTVLFNQKARLIRVHSKLAQVPEEIEDRCICVNELPTEFLHKIN